MQRNRGKEHWEWGAMDSYPCIKTTARAHPILSSVWHQRFVFGIFGCPALVRVERFQLCPGNKHVSAGTSPEASFRKTMSSFFYQWDGTAFSMIGLRICMVLRMHGIGRRQTLPRRPPFPSQRCWVRPTSVGATRLPCLTNGSTRQKEGSKVGRVALAIIIVICC